MARTQENPPVSSLVETNASVGGQLSSTVVTYIVISGVGGMIAILLMLFGNFEGKVSRVISTLLLFALFTLCSSYHLGRSKAAMRSTLLSQSGNIYMLILGLVLIWGTLAVNNYQDITILPMTLCIVGLVQLGIFVTEYIAKFMDSPHKQLTTAAYLTSAGMTCTTALFTLPIGLNDLVSFGEGYWRFAVAILLFTGIMISITGFIVWAFRSDISNEQNSTMPTQRASSPPQYPGTKPFNQVPDHHKSFPEPSSVNVVPPVEEKKLEFKVEAPAPAPEKPMVAESSPYLSQGVPEFASPVFAPTPWPVFPNGQPLPANSNGRPDFTSLVLVANIYAESERQFFG